MTENSVLLGVPASRGLSSLLRLKMYQINRDEVSSILAVFPSSCAMMRLITVCTVPKSLSYQFATKCGRPWTLASRKKPF